MNVGARTETDYGDYFAWGATTPFYMEYNGYGAADPHWISGKTGYDWTNYPFMQSGQSGYQYITKYTFADGQTEGIWYEGGTFKGDNGDGVEHKDFASYDYVDDAARANWGGTWRTPTDAEWTWLRTNCTWTWAAQNGVNGMLVRSKVAGYTDKTIFLPAAGKRENANLNNAGSYGCYWSSSLYETYSDCAWGVYFKSGRFDWDSPNRFSGQSIRPVME